MYIFTNNKRHKNYIEFSTNFIKICLPLSLLYSEVTIMSLAELLLLSLFVYTAAIPLKKFYPFGLDARDTFENESFTFFFGDQLTTVSNNTVYYLSERCVIPLCMNNKL